MTPSSAVIIMKGGRRWMACSFRTTFLICFGFILTIVLSTLWIEQTRSMFLMKTVNNDANENNTIKKINNNAISTTMATTTSTNNIASSSHNNNNDIFIVTKGKDYVDTNDADDDEVTGETDAPTPAGQEETMEGEEETMEEEGSIGEEAMEETIDVEDNDDEEDAAADYPPHKKPKIAWLMSYPNSGTSYTITSVAQISNRSFATNYGEEVLNEKAVNETSTCIYGNDICFKNGPYYRHYTNEESHYQKGHLLPENYIITKTHCGGRCVRCGSPEQYQLSLKDYMSECTRGTGKVRKPGTKNAWEKVYYPKAWVSKAIHLIRNPFHNIISRYHLSRKHYISRLQQNSKQSDEFITNFMNTQYPDNGTGFFNWCNDLQIEFYDKHSKDSNNIENKQLNCWFEFYKYTSWHNLAIQTLQTLREDYSLEDTLIIYYENYEPKTWNTTMSSILDFLQLETDSQLINETIQTHPFTARHDYDAYFSTEQKELAVNYIKKFSTNDTWNLIQHYF